MGSLLSFQRDRLTFFQRVVRECGEIGTFHVGPYRMVFVNSARLVYGMFVEKAPSFVKGKKIQFLRAVVGQNSLVTLDGPYHRQQRRLHAHAFQYKRMAGYCMPMVDFTDELQKTLAEGDRVDLRRELTHLTSRIIRKTLFDLDNQVEDEDFSSALRVAESYLEYMSSHLFALPLSFPTVRNRRLRHAVAKMRAVVQTLVDTRRRTGGDHGDFLSMLLSSSDEEGTRLTDEQVMDHALTMYTAGHETSANALTWVFIELARHPEVAAKVQQEVDGVLKGRRPTHEDLLRLPYTLQVIKETLRMWPVLYAGGRTPIEDVELGGYQLKKGEPVLFSPYTLHRDPRHFPDPERFDPDRFLPEREKELPRGAYLPFGAGPHVCIGAQFAMMEMHLVVALLVQHISFSLAPGQDIHPALATALQASSSWMIVHRRASAKSPQPAVQASAG